MGQIVWLVTKEANRHAIEDGLRSKIHELVRSCSRGEERSSRNAKPCTHILYSQQPQWGWCLLKENSTASNYIEQKNVSTFECENVLSCETHFKYSVTENETQFTDGILGEHDYQCCNHGILGEHAGGNIGIT